VSSWQELGPRTDDEVAFTRAEILAARSQPPLTVAPRPDTRRVAQHGTRAKYVAGCHCAACRAAQAAYTRSRYTPEAARAKYLRHRARRQAAA
jgi:hypothetical protein